MLLKLSKFLCELSQSSHKLIFEEKPLLLVAVMSTKYQRVYIYGGKGFVKPFFSNVNLLRSGSRTIISAPMPLTIILGSRMALEIFQQRNWSFRQRAKMAINCSFHSSSCHLMDPKCPPMVEQMQMLKIGSVAPLSSP